MKAQLETIHLSKTYSSFNFFELELPFFPSHWHYHPELELTYIKRGQGLRFVGDHIQSFEAGDLVLLGENLPHNWVSEQHPTGALQSAYVLQFSNNIFQAFRECQPIFELFKKAQYGLHFHAPTPGFLEKMESIQQLVPIRRLTCLIDLLYDLSEDQAYTKLSSITYDRKLIFEKHQSRILAITSYIIEHLDQRITLDEVAQFSGMSAPSFCRWFKHSTGNTFVTYLNTVRIERACQFLIQTEWQVAQIAYRCGFETISNFNRTFKRFKTVSPSIYRNNQEQRKKLLLK